MARCGSRLDRCRLCGERGFFFGNLAAPAISGILTAIEDGLYQPSMKARMEELERQKAEIGVRLREMPPDLPDVNPNVAELYRVQVAQLAAALQEPDVDPEAAGK